mmetsp:Transcript_29539/g.47225  ORF Transcript_29539/g.47225 Transcript_29539/m.47225 type:complete len:106 (-) Transcript_29539:1187-1504(-)
MVAFAMLAACLWYCGFEHAMMVRFVFLNVCNCLMMFLLFWYCKNVSAWSMMSVCVCIFWAYSIWLNDNSTMACCAPCMALCRCHIALFFNLLVDVGPRVNMGLLG